MNMQAQQAQPETFGDIAADWRAGMNPEPGQPMGAYPQGAATPEEQPPGEQQTGLETGAEYPETGQLQQEGGDPENNAEQVPEGETQTMTYAELAEAIEVPPEFLYNNVVVGMGEGVDPIPLGELKDRYVANEAELRELRANAQSHQPAFAQAPSDHDMQMLQFMYQRDMKRLQDAEQAIPWNELRTKNPGEFAAQQTQFTQARQNLEHEYGQIWNQMNAAKQQFMGNMAHQAKAYLQDKMPKWADPKVRIADLNLIRNTAKEFGYSDQEVEAAADPRYMLAMLELGRLRAEKGMAQQTMTGVKPKPMMRAGSRTGVRTDNVDRLTERAKTTRSRGDILNAARAIYSQGRT